MKKGLVARGEKDSREGDRGKRLLEKGLRLCRGKGERGRGDAIAEKRIINLTAEKERPSKLDISPSSSRGRERGSEGLPGREGSAGVHFFREKRREICFFLSSLEKES